MVVRKEAWAEGTPAWVDLTASDVDATRTFYSELFGWQFEEADREYGGYSNALLDGETVAAVYPVMEGGEDAPKQWMTYLAVDDAQASAAKVKSSGGQCLVEPMQVGAYGTMSVFVGPDNGVFGTWQSGEHTGYNRVNAHGAVAWNELMSRDYDKARTFYTAVFGFAYEDIGEGDMTYATIKVDDRVVGGIGKLDGTNAPAEVPSFWGVYFGSDDVDATVAKAIELGGKQVREAMDTPFGRMATLSGPDGEFFQVNSVGTAT